MSLVYIYFNILMKGTSVVYMVSVDELMTGLTLMSGRDEPLVWPPARMRYGWGEN